VVKGLDRNDIKILEVLKGQEATWAEIREKTGMDHVLLYRRLKRLKRMGLITQKEKRGPWSITRKGLKELEEKIKDEAGLAVDEAGQELLKKGERGSRKGGYEGYRELMQYIDFLKEEVPAEVAVLEILNLLYLVDLALVEEILRHSRSLDEAVRMFSREREKLLEALYNVLNLPDDRWVEGRESFKELLKYMWYPIVIKRFKEVLRIRKIREQRRRAQ